MKYLLTFLFAISAQAADLTFVNTTPWITRIDQLHNKCQGFLVQDIKPVFLKPGESKTFENATPVVHIYTVCGNGLCSSSAFGLNNTTNKYTLNLVVKDGIIDLTSTPDHWVGNLECK